MGASEVVSTGKAIGDLTVMGLMGLIVVVLAVVAVVLWRDGKSWMNRFVLMLEAQYTDAGRRKDLFDELAKGLDAQAQATRDVRQEIASFRSDMQRGRP